MREIYEAGAKVLAGHNKCTAALYVRPKESKAQGFMTDYSFCAREAGDLRLVYEPFSAIDSVPRTPQVMEVDRLFFCIDFPQSSNDLTAPEFEETNMKKGPCFFERKNPAG